ncbi:MAG: hypothetical protein P8048_00340 [Calditrichia bacterium]
MDKSKFNDKREWRKFGIALAVLLFIISAVQYFKQIELYSYFLAASVLFLLSALALPILIKPVFILFSYIGFGMGWVMTRIILFILFYLFITPISILARKFGNRFLDLRFDRSKESYWLPVKDNKNNRENFEKQF